MLKREAIARVLFLISVIIMGFVAISAYKAANEMQTIIGPIMIIILYVLALLAGRASPNLLQPSLRMSTKIRSSSGEFYLKIQNYSGSLDDYGDAMVHFDCYDRPFKFNANKDEGVVFVGNYNIRLGSILRIGKKSTEIEIKLPDQVKNLVAAGKKDQIYVTLYFKNSMLGFQFSRYLHLKEASIDDTSTS